MICARCLSVLSLLAGWSIAAGAGEVAPSPIPPEAGKLASSVSYSVDLGRCLGRNVAHAEELLRVCTYVATNLRVGGATFQLRQEGISQEDVDGVHSAVLEARAAALVQLGRPMDAFLELRRAAQLQRRSPWILNNMGVIAEAAGQRDKAIDFYTRAGRGDSGLEVARRNLAALTEPPPAPAPTTAAKPTPPPPKAAAATPEATKPRPAPEPTPVPVLDPDVVRRAQSALAELGFPVGAADGVMGQRTRQALRTWQASRGIDPDRPLDEAIALALESESRADRLTRAQAQRQAPPSEEPARAEAKPAPEPPSPPARERSETAALPRADGEPVAALPTVQPLPKAETVTTRPTTPEPAKVVEPGTSRRVALVIGNAAYKWAPTLANPVNDSMDFAAALRRLGFTVMEGVDLDRAAMEDLMLRFARAAREAEMAVAFYAGHGVQVAGRNYLLPIDAKLEDETDLRRSIALDAMVDDAGRAQKLALVIVDACRDNPLARQLARSMGAARSTAIGRGLASPGEVPRQTMIAYSTQADATAADGTGRNSPFTEALLKHLAEPGLEVRLLFGKVRDAVLQATRGQQDPPIYGALGGEPIYLVPPAAAAAFLDLERLEPAERRALQRALTQLGFYNGPMDSAASYQLRGAVRDYQLSQGMAANGRLTAAQLVELHALARYKQPPLPLPKIDLIDLLRRAEAGEAVAQLQRGQLHDTAFEQGPLPKSNAEAVRWYERAARQGNQTAAGLLGMILKDGNGVEPLPEMAASWLQQAAEAGSWRAQYALAELYRDGRGVTSDVETARRWFKDAAKQPEGGAAISQLRLLGD